MNSQLAKVKVVRAGLFATVQDKGRFGLRHLGIPWAGALCPAWQAISNKLVGNNADAPVIECFEGGLQLEAIDHPVRFSIVGCESAVIKIGNGIKERSYRPNRTLTLAPGESLLLSSTGNSRHALIAIAGIQILEHLGSASTYAKASLGGLDGRVLNEGDEISVKPAVANESVPYIEQQCCLPIELLYNATEIRAIAGPQFGHFSKQGIDSFLSSQYELGGEADRMGARLFGPVITHRDASAKDIVSDAIVPGSIQVPGTGQPIVLLNDAHTAGGYPKIATVISSDLPLLGIQRAGSTFRFTLIEIHEAIEIRRSFRQLVESCLATFTPCITNELDTQTLLSLNLIDGVTDGS